MARVKVIYGTPTTQENYWAYAVKNNKVVIVRCNTLRSAAEEKERMKHSDATTVGYTTKAISELDMRSECRRRGWKLEVIR